MSAHGASSGEGETGSQMAQGSREQGVCKRGELGDWKGHMFVNQKSQFTWHRGGWRGLGKLRKEKAF